MRTSAMNQIFDRLPVEYSTSSAAQLDEDRDRRHASPDLSTERLQFERNQNEFRIEPDAAGLPQIGSTGGRLPESRSAPRERLV
ncbi:hypothetical protein N1031_00055 [Herbiconiux moechotypicola]|uniref:hypothetical protein n=1 Tax=Herbiconiux moechotypicola TaxID=637393 RepID=UPI00217DFEA2|nr:hypothetical protein [Herbiconiux moechotypicola]MCS5728142.1 hypothetical protein [Herbiconiux moechotypicola]